MAYPTPEGTVLGSIIWNNMVDSFGTGKWDFLFDDCFIKCFQSSENPELNGRVNNMKSYVAIREGLAQYINGYSSIETVTTGTVVGQVSKRIVNVTEADDAKLNGYVDVYNRMGVGEELLVDNMFSLYSIPMVFGTTGAENYTEGAEELFKIILSWLSFPFIDVDLYGTAKGVNIKGNGTIKFGSNEEFPDKRTNKDTILQKILDEMPALNDEMVSSLNENGEIDPELFEKFWTIIGSGVVEYMNINEVTTKDIGANTMNWTIGGVPQPPDIGVYNGSSEGEATFGDTLVAKINIVLEVPQVDFSIPFKLDIPPICFGMNIKDEFGVRKKTRVCLDFNEIQTNIADLVTKVVEAVQNAISGAMEKIAKILNGIQAGIDEIERVLSEAFETFIEGAIAFVEAIFAKVEEYVTKLLEMYIIPLVEKARGVLWSAALAAAGAGRAVLQAIYDTFKALEYLQSQVASLEIIQKTIELIQKINDTIEEVNEDIAETLEEINESILEALGQDDENEKCACILNLLSFLGTLSLPAIPTIPVPEFSTPEAKCPTGEFNDDGTNVCGPCTSATAGNVELYGPCPDEDGNPVEIPEDLPPFDFVPVVPSDPDYQTVADSASNIIVTPPVPDLASLITVPEIPLFKTVILDNGHGGIINGQYQTAGKRSPRWSDGLQIFEGVYNRQVVDGIKEQLGTSGIPYYEVANTQEDKPLSDRTDEANSLYNADNSIYVSVHANAYDASRDARGWEAYSFNYDGASAEYVDTFYSLFHDNFEGMVPTAVLRSGSDDTHYGKVANFHVLRETTMPAILTENFFMTNESECRNYLQEDSEGQQRAINLHVAAIDRIARYR